ncbi:MAG TPA: hypothetical protein VJ869_04015 [Sphaerochaeta sp.]|nr:hypothetical protein [Sphaerochaeta sp.]
MNNLPKNEHPTPQFMRNDWINLNGVWTYTINMRPPYFSDKRSYNHEGKKYRLRQDPDTRLQKHPK